jgi:hypothetical protein
MMIHLSLFLQVSFYYYIILTVIVTVIVAIVAIPFTTNRAKMPASVR